MQEEEEERRRRRDKGRMLCVARGGLIEVRATRLKVERDKTMEHSDFDQTDTISIAISS